MSPNAVSAVVQERCCSKAQKDRCCSVHCTTLTTAGAWVPRDTVPQNTILQVHVRSCWSIVTPDRHMFLPSDSMVKLYRASNQ